MHSVTAALSSSDPVSVYLLSKSPFNEVTSAFSSLMLWDSRMRLVVEEACKYKDRKKQQPTDCWLFMFFTQFHWLISKQKSVSNNILGFRCLHKETSFTEWSQIYENIFDHQAGSSCKTYESFTVLVPKPHFYHSISSLQQTTSLLIRAGGIERTDLQTSTGHSQKAVTKKE